MIVGFTGTRAGMSPQQRSRVRDLLEHLYNDPPILRREFHHGDCIGADEQAHEIAQLIGFDIVIHPPDNSRAQAFCKGAWIIHDPLPYLVRNKGIVNASDILIAAPGEFTEQLRSGTWSTIRYARKRGKRHLIVAPNGSMICIT